MIYRLYQQDVYNCKVRNFSVKAMLITQQKGLKRHIKKRIKFLG
jgi:hypothetical protein